MYNAFEFNSGSLARSITEILLSKNAVLIYVLALLEIGGAHV